MNKIESAPVQFAMRLMVPLAAMFHVLFLSGCSGSRTVAVEQELPVGNHVAKTVIESDLLVPRGTTLAVDYSRASRFFVEDGAALSGFPKGVRDVTIFAEKGAMIPDAREQRGFFIRTVEDAAETWRNRFTDLPPVGMDTPVPGAGGVVPVVGVGAGVGFWNGPWGWWGGSGWRGGRAPRPTSVRPSSYRKNN
jgi:hypothetical protein